MEVVNRTKRKILDLEMIPFNFSEGVRLGFRWGFVIGFLTGMLIGAILHALIS